MNSEPAITWERAPRMRAAQTAVEYLLRDLEESEDRKRKRRQTDRDRLEQALGALALELFAARCDGTGGWRRYSRAKDGYKTRDRYSRSPITHTAACTAADWLLAAGYAEGWRGHYRRYPGFDGNPVVGQQSRIRATDHLMSLFCEEFGLDQYDVGFAPWIETIVLRDGRGDEKRDVPYEDTPETVLFREKLARINDHLAGFRLSRMVNGSVVHIGPSILRRIFSRGTFELGGRFFGAPWIQMASKDRRSILIDGEETVELDFSALHPRLIYQLQHEPLAPSVDPYGLGRWSEGERRGWAKHAFQKLLNAKPHSPIRRPPGVPYSKLKADEWKQLVADLIEHHYEISDWFRTGKGLQLQRIDSEIAEGVLLRMVDQGVCCLPIHDGFIVPTSHASALHRAMVDSYTEVMSRMDGGNGEPVVHAQ
jgi:hypothetical protein